MGLFDKQWRGRSAKITGLIIAVLTTGAIFCLPVLAGDDGRITIDYKDAELSSVLKAIAYSNDLNLVMTKDVKGVVSANLSDVTIDEALNAILSVNGYTFVREGKLIYVIPGSGIEGLGKKTMAIQLSYLSADQAKILLGKAISSQGDIQVNSATNSLVVTDYQANLNSVHAILGEIDVPPLQVLIEAKILDIQAKAFENVGTTLSIAYDPKGEGVGGGLFGKKSTYDESLSVATDMAGPSVNLSGGQLTLTTALQNYTVNATIDALIQDNKAHLLASPSIMTLNGKEARIIIGDKVPIIEKTITDTTTTETTQFVDVGTTLRVTPQVSPDGWITMNVHPEVSSVTANLTAGPNITTREADAVVRVKDGQTIIIGGLISKQDDRINSGVPGLRSIPILGKLFSKRSKDLQEKELTVFITPHIIGVPASQSSGTVEKKESASLNAGLGEINLVAKLMEHARNLEQESSVESADKSYRDRREGMLNIYKLISTQFPQSKEADLALYRLGELYYYFKNYPEAIRAFEKLRDEYRFSPYLLNAENYIKKAVDRQNEREELITREMYSLEK